MNQLIDRSIDQHWVVAYCQKNSSIKTKPSNLLRTAGQRSDFKAAKSTVSNKFISGPHVVKLADYDLEKQRKS